MLGQHYSLLWDTYDISFLTQRGGTDTVKNAQYSMFNKCNFEKFTHFRLVHIGVTEHNA